MSRTIPLTALALIVVLAASCERQETEIAPPPSVAQVTPAAPPDPLEVFRRPWDSEAHIDGSLANKLAEMSRDAYLAPEEVKAAFRAMGFQEVVTVARDTATVHVATSGDLAVAVFADTKHREAKDCIADLSLSSTPVQDGKVHEGFWTTYGDLRTELIPLLRGKTYIWLTGHSLGGALAACGAYDLQRNQDMKPTGVITFGQPLFANESLATYMDTIMLGRYATIVNRDDIVPRIPPSFKPCGRLVWIKDDGVYRSKPWVLPFTISVDRSSATEPEAEITPLSPKEFEDLKATVTRNREAAQPEPVEPNAAANDHSIAEYVSQLRRFFPSG